MVTDFGVEDQVSKGKRTTSTREGGVRDEADVLLHGGKNVNEDTGGTNNKRTKVVTSKIKGLAEKRKPRIGPDYQADIPSWS